MPRIRVLVVEDSATVRQRLCDTLNADPEIELVGHASDGRRAIELCGGLRPDVVTLDMMLPVMTGVAATEQIMAHYPTPILIVSASTNRGELFKTYEALAAGAVDVLEKPRGDEADGAWEQRFLSAVKLVSRIKVITHLRARLGREAPRPQALPGGAARHPPARCRVAAIGASTGGPAAIVDLLRAIPPPLSFPILIVLHIDEPFGTSFAEWLDAQTPHRVAYARDEEATAPLSGRVVMAPPGRHLMVRSGRVHLTSDPERHSCRPSVDTLFESLAVEYGTGVVACLLTGMGRDGAAGMLEIRRAGGFTIAQDEATSVVYGMPREALRLGGVDRVLALNEIGRVLGNLSKSTETVQ